MQALLVPKLPEGDRWLYEVKLDGYRAIAIKNGDDIEIRSRNNKDLTKAYPAVCSAVKTVRAQRVVLDGEIVAVDSSGRPSFQALQHRSARTDHQIAYYVFDLLHVDGMDTTQLPLHERRAMLTTVVKGSQVLLSAELEGSATQVATVVGDLGLEGVIAKRRDSKYEAAQRSGTWQKLKLDRQQEFVIGGFRPTVRTVDALLVGYYDGRSLKFAGKVRAGMTPQMAIQAGYERAFGTILDANITTLIAGLALFAFGSGPVRGFAVVLCLGILTSMFSGVMVSRALVNLLYGRRRRIERLPIGNTQWK